MITIFNNILIIGYVDQNIEFFYAREIFCWIKPIKNCLELMGKQDGCLFVIKNV